MKTFNTTGACVPEKHYMVDISERLQQIRIMVERGDYFTIHRARQYGKTTTLTALGKSLLDAYVVLQLDFQQIGDDGFRTETAFVKAFCRMVLRSLAAPCIPEEIRGSMESFLKRQDQMAGLNELFVTLSDWCEQSVKPIVLMIDEVDSAANHPVFLDFLGQLRAQYLARETNTGRGAMQSVILAGVTDIRNLKRRVRGDEEQKLNSPWNIAADFHVKMRLDASGIQGMLDDYEADHQTGMDTHCVANEIFAFTEGYPFLVSRICQILDEQLLDTAQFVPAAARWSVQGVSEAVRRLLADRNSLFDSLMAKVQNDPDLANTLRQVLYDGEKQMFNRYDLAVDDARMYGFLRDENGTLHIANRIFETLLYDYFIFMDRRAERDLIDTSGEAWRPNIVDGKLQMEAVLENYSRGYRDVYGDAPVPFDEAEGRRRFLLYLRPIINGTGNYYIEAETRNRERMDVVIDFMGERFVVELKIWRGQAYHERGEKQLAGYLAQCRLQEGYLLTYSFNQTKESGISRVMVDGKRLVEVLV